MALDSPFVWLSSTKTSPLPAMRPGGTVTVSTRVSRAVNGARTATAGTFIVSGNVQPATSYGGFPSIIGYRWGSSRSLACARNGWAIGTTRVPAG